MDSKTVGEPNLDPISGTPGAHPVGTGVGATGGGTAGAIIGAAGGPVGAAVGLAVGAVAGGLAGKSATEFFDPTREDAYWRDKYQERPYVQRDETYETYQPAYRTGYEGRARYTGKDYADVESDLQRDYETSTQKKGLSWDRAKEAVKDAWRRLDEYLPGDSNGDGR